MEGKFENYIKKKGSTTATVQYPGGYLNQYRDFALEGGKAGDFMIEACRLSGVSTTASFGLAILCTVLVFSGLQMYKTHLGSTRLMTLIAGYIASWLFIFMLTALSNLENIMFGKGFQARVIPEVAMCLILACCAAGMVHRVSVTVCLLCSVVGLFYLNKMSQSASTAPSAPAMANSKKKK